jgi:hypothetical protein
MNNNVWKGSFKRLETKFPSEIAVEFCNQLYNLTDRKVIAKVEKYEDSFFDMNKVAPILNIANMSPLLKSGKIEENLGEISGNNRFTYELYLTGAKTTEYKYRFCFIENGVYPYPVKIAIDSNIANELQTEKIVECKNEEEYEKVLTAILNSKKMREVIEGLMTINY